MEIFLVRHADAVEGDPSTADAHRPLTAAGRRDARDLGERLARAGVRLEALIASPLVRAVETAELLAVGLGFEGALDVAPELIPAYDPTEVVAEVLLPRAQLERVALVGHEPQLGLLLRALLQSGAPNLAKAAAVRLSWEGPDLPARFRWVLRPGMKEPAPELGALI